MVETSKTIVYNILNDGFDKAGILDLCFSLNYDEFDDSTSKSTIVRYLTDYCFRQGKTNDLLKAIQNTNPHVYAQYFNMESGSSSTLRDTKAIGQIVLDVEEARLSEIVVHLSKYLGEGIVTLNVKTRSIELTFIASLAAINHLFLAIEQGDAELNDLNVKGLTLVAPSLEESNFIGANLQGADLRGANLTGADLRGANLGEARLERAILNKANLLGVNLIRANLTAAHLERANLEKAFMELAYLQRANLQRVSLQRANLRRANLEWADLRGAILLGAKLLGAKLQGANLQGANLQGADLERADLRWAFLQEANLRGANLQGAKYNPETIWPTRFAAEAAGAHLRS